MYVKKFAKKNYKRYLFFAQRVLYIHLYIFNISENFLHNDYFSCCSSNLADFRQQLFNAAKPIFMNETQWDVYFPYMDNVWSLHKTLGETRQGLTTLYYHCRLVCKTHQPKRKPEPTSPDQKRSDRPPPKWQIREGSACQMQLKVVRSKPNQNDPMSLIYTIPRHSDTKECKEDTNTLLELDALKWNSALRDIAKAESSNGYAPAVITHALGGIASEMSQTDLEAAGGCYLMWKDIQNAGIAWRQANSNPCNLHPTNTSFDMDLSEAGEFLSAQHCC
jgi:hypothetical protein